VRRVWLLAWLPILACSDWAVQSGARALPGDSSAALSASGAAAGKELIPAEWTVFEDTSETGEVTTASLQLPAAKDIGGLGGDEAPRLMLRCVDGRVEASIETEPSEVRIQLDSAPPCE
jgi:hypothetical protein